MLTSIISSKFPFQKTEYNSIYCRAVVLDSIRYIVYSLCKLLLHYTLITHSSHFLLLSVSQSPICTFQTRKPKRVKNQREGRGTESLSASGEDPVKAADSLPWQERSLTRNENRSRLTTPCRPLLFRDYLTHYLSVLLRTRQKYPSWKCNHFHASTTWGDIFSPCWRRSFHKISNHIFSIVRSEIIFFKPYVQIALQQHTTLNWLVADFKRVDAAQFRNINQSLVAFCSQQ